MKQRNISPYSSSDLGDWLESKKREANVVNQCCGPETTVTQRSQLDELLCDHTVKFVIALNIKVFGKDDYTEYADKYNQGRSDENPRQLQPTPIYQKMAKVRSTVGRFKDFVERNSHITTARCVVTEEVRGDAEEADVHLVLYRDGMPVTNEFCPPSAVSGLQVIEIGPENFCFVNGMGACRIAKTLSALGPSFLYPNFYKILLHNICPD